MQAPVSGEEGLAGGRAGSPAAFPFWTNFSLKVDGAGLPGVDSLGPGTPSSPSKGGR